MLRKADAKVKLRAIALAGCAMVCGLWVTPGTADPAGQVPLIAQGCIGCHGQAGAGRGSVPKIAGYDRDLFIAQWNAFRQNQRPATIMNRVATGYTDAEAAALADYFSKLK